VEYFDKRILGFKNYLLGKGMHYNGPTKQNKEEKRWNIKAKGTYNGNFSSRTIKVFLTIFA
jgi:hypothetical protein